MTDTDERAWTAAAEPPRAAIQVRLCVLCGACRDVCPRGAILMEDGAVAVGAACDGCGACLIACVPGAIELADRPASLSGSEPYGTIPSSAESGSDR